MATLNYFCNTCENEDDFIIVQGHPHCTSCGSSDVEVIRQEDIEDIDIFVNPYDDLEDLYK
jgi:uncharacterized Zn finger protein